MPSRLSEILKQCRDSSICTMEESEAIASAVRFAQDPIAPRVFFEHDWGAEKLTIIDDLCSYKEEPE